VVFLRTFISYLCSLNVNFSQDLILSGLATGASWLCYYKALQMGNATEVSAVDKFSLVITLVLAFFFLQDVLTFKTIIGCILITIGTLVMIL